MFLIVWLYRWWIIGRGPFTTYQFNFLSINVDNMRMPGGGMLFSLEITGAVILVGIVWGMLLAIIRLSDIEPLQMFGQAYVNLFRFTPLVMVLLRFFLTVPQVLQKILNLSPTTDIRMASVLIASALFETAYYSEIIRAGIQSVSRGQMLTAYAIGMTCGQAMCLVILLQAFRSMVPLPLIQVIVLFQDTLLVYVNALSDFFAQAYNVGERDGRIAELLLFVGLYYFVVYFGVSVLVKRSQKKVTQ